MKIYQDICPECGSGNVQRIDSGREVESGEAYDRIMCWDCDADIHVSQETREIL